MVSVLCVCDGEFWKWKDISWGDMGGEREKTRLENFRAGFFKPKFLDAALEERALL